MRPRGSLSYPSHSGNDCPLRESKEEEEGISSGGEREERRRLDTAEEEKRENEQRRSSFPRAQVIDIPLLNALIHSKAIEGDLEGIEAMLEDLKSPLHGVEEEKEQIKDLPVEEMKKKNEKNRKVIQIYGVFDDVTFKNLLFAASKAHRPDKSEE